MNPLFVLGAIMMLGDSKHGGAHIPKGYLKHMPSHRAMFASAAKARGKKGVPMPQRDERGKKGVPMPQRDDDDQDPDWGDSEPGSDPVYWWDE